ncbi:gamma-glutamyl-gamma-aminobutyrate hydrolase family protein [Pseudodesulfovibrio sp.]|uniref:gamma-glutamyl-gamma-aminobutyrate hydrolase family protein n=1 Tax=unclassified Pseudodesulfovibrio TaxID=2661612 RepID=UPI003AFFB0CA
MSTFVRIAITTRIVNAEGYDESRDALAHDWADFMQAVLPEAVWMPFPNVGPGAASMAEAWGLDGIILSGGNDIGEQPLRDATEASLLQWALSRSKPVFGVCRGLQMLQTFFGGDLVSCRNHVATRHEVLLCAHSALGESGITMDVNSFHTRAIATPAPDLDPLAMADDHAEAMRHSVHPVAGVMWHPERETSPSKFDITFIRKLFLGDK